MGLKSRKLTIEENNYVLEKIYQFVIYSKLFIVNVSHIDNFNDLSGRISDLDNKKYVNLFSLFNLERNYKENIVFKIKKGQSLDDVILENYHGYIGHIFEFDEKDLVEFLGHKINIKTLLDNRIFVHTNNNYPEIVIMPLNIVSKEHFNNNGEFLDFTQTKNRLMNFCDELIPSMKIENIEQIIVLEDIGNIKGKYREGICYVHINALFYAPDEDIALKNYKKSINQIITHEFTHYIDNYFFKHYSKSNQDLIKNNKSLLSTINNPEYFIKNHVETKSLFQTFDILKEHLSIYNKTEYDNDLLAYFDVLKMQYPEHFTEERVGKIWQLKEKYNSFKSLTLLDNLDTIQDMSAIEKKFKSKFNNLLSLNVFNYNNNEEDTYKYEALQKNIVEFLTYDFTENTKIPSSSLYFTFAQLNDLINKREYFTLKSEMLAFLYTKQDEQTEGVAKGKELEHFHQLIYKSFNKIFEQISLPTIKEQFQQLSLENTIKKISTRTNKKHI